jgi:hypothetical protein
VALILAVTIGIGVVVAIRVQADAVVPREAILRVIDDGGKPGPKVMTTQVVPLP